MQKVGCTSFSIQRGMRFSYCQASHESREWCECHGLGRTSPYNFRGRWWTNQFSNMVLCTYSYLLMYLDTQYMYPPPRTSTKTASLANPYDKPHRVWRRRRGCKQIFRHTYVPKYLDR